MFDALVQPIAWGTPGGIGFFFISLGIFLWGLAQYEKMKKK